MKRVGGGEEEGDL
jgi:hypothetical protein